MNTLFELLKYRLTREQKITVFASWLGWSLDGYDLVLMLFVISSVNQLFFPTQDPTLSLLATFATYTVALIMRPLGGALFGSFGDRHGRKNTMMITVTGIFSHHLSDWPATNLEYRRNNRTNIINTSQICTRTVCRWGMGKWIIHNNGNYAQVNPWIAFRFPAKWIYLWISYGVDSFSR